MVVYHNHVVRTVQLLAKGRFHCIGHGTLAVADGYYDRCQHGETALSGIDFGSRSGLEIAVNELQVLGAGGFHLYLDITVARVHIVKLFLARCTEISLCNGVERLRHTYYGQASLDCQT